MINIIDNSLEYDSLISNITKTSKIYLQISSGTDEDNFLFIPERDILYVIDQVYLDKFTFDIKLIETDIYLYNTRLNIATNSTVIDTDALYYSIFKVELNESNLNENNIPLKLAQTRVNNFIHTRNSEAAIIPTTLASEYYYLLFKTLNGFIEDYKHALNNPEYVAFIKRKNAFKLLMTSGVHVNNNLIEGIKESAYSLEPTIQKTVDTLGNNKDSIIYPEFNFARSPTGRVASSYNSLNMMALNKSDETRLFFNSRFKDGYLVEFDFDGMHLRIIASILNFEIPLDIPAHKFMATIFFDKHIDDITDDDVKRSKKKIWSILYGTIYFDHHFIKKINAFKEYKVLKTKTPLGRKIDLGVDEDKRFNYFIQKFEVDYITSVLSNVSKYIIDSRIKMRPVIYQYDAIIFDIPPDEIGQLKHIQDILETSIEGLHLKTKMKAGKNFKKLQLL